MVSVRMRWRAGTRPKNVAVKIETTRVKPGLANQELSVQEQETQALATSKHQHRREPAVTREILLAGPARSFLQQLPYDLSTARPEGYSNRNLLFS